jgi:hypothetical protein
MGDQRWTKETTLLVARTIHDDECTPGEPDWDDLRQAQLIIAALADAGLLLPPGSETKEEWGWRVDVEHPRRREKVGTVVRCHESNARMAPTAWHGWTTVKRIYRPRWTGPWQEVPDEH